MKNSILSLIVLLLVTNYHTNAQGLSWAQGFTATGSPSSSAIGNFTVGDNDNIYVIGGFKGTIDVDQSANVYNLTSIGNYNWYLLKETSTGGYLWAKHFTGSSSSNGYINPWSICQDKGGNIYIGGAFRDSFDFDPSTNMYYMTTPTNYLHAFILKLDALGDFIWAKQIGGITGTAGIASLKIDETGKLCLFGGFSGSIDADPGAGVTTLNSITLGDLLIEKLDTAGNLVWAKQIPGAGATGGLDIDSSSSFYISGTFSNTVDFDPGTGIANLTSAGNSDIFIEKLDSIGNFQWAKQIGGGSDDIPQGIATDRWGNVSVTGYFGGTVDFDPGAGVYNLTSNSTRSAFTLKLRNNGDFAWAKMAGASVGLFDGRAITTDSAGNVYTALELPGGCDMDPGPGVYNVPAGVAVQKLDSSSNFVWARGWGADIPGWIGLDHAGSVYTTGSFSGSNVDFDPGPGVFLLSGSSAGSGFIEKLCASPTGLLTADTNAICNGDTAHLTAPLVAGGSYNWLRNNVTVATNTTNLYSAYLSGSYRAEITGLTCPYQSNAVIITAYAILSPTINITVSPGSTPPVGQTVTLTASLMNAGSNYTIDWYKNNSLFATTTTSTTTYIKQAGTDTITAIVKIPTNPCADSGISSPRIITSPDGITEILAAAGLSISPNPFEGFIHLQGLAKGDQLMMADIAGRTMYTTTPTETSLSIPTSAFAPGWYLLRITDASGRPKVNMPVVKR